MFLLFIERFDLGGGRDGILWNENYRPLLLMETHEPSFKIASRSVYHFIFIRTAWLACRLVLYINAFTSYKRSEMRVPVSERG